MLLCITMVIGVAPISVSADGQTAAADNNGLLAFYAADAMTVGTNNCGYTDSLVMTLPLSEKMPYRHLTPGTVANNVDNTRYTLSITNNNITMEEARYVKVRYRGTSSNGISLAPMVDGKRLYDYPSMGAGFVLDGEWHEYVYDIGAYNYRGGDILGSETNNSNDPAADFEHLKSHRFTGFLLRPFGNGGTNTGNEYFDVAWIAFFGTSQDAEKYTYVADTAKLNIGIEGDGSFTISDSEAMTSYSGDLAHRSYTLKATPSELYDFAGWYDGTTLLSADATYTYTLSADASLTAKFTLSPCAVFMADGTEFAKVKLDSGKLVYPTNVPTKAGYGFAGWDVVAGTEVEDGKVVNAVFEAPKALFDATNYKNVTSGSTVWVASMFDSTYGKYYRIYDGIANLPTQSGDGARAGFAFDTEGFNYDVSTDKYFAFGYRTNVSRVGGLNPYMASYNNVRLWGTDYAVNADGRWHNSVINFDNFNGGNLPSGTTAAEFRSGMLSRLDIRPHGNAAYNVNDGDYHDVLYIAVFDNEAAAKNYVYAGNELGKTESTYNVKFYGTDKTTLISEQTVVGGNVSTPTDVTLSDNCFIFGWADKSTDALVTSMGTTVLSVTADSEFYAIEQYNVLGNNAYKDYITVRGNGLNNFYAKMKAKQPLKVAYLGGSVTAGAGSTGGNSWRETSYAYIQSKMPSGNAGITMINGAIGGSGSRAGAFRVDTDIIAQQPDLVFVEFVVNDAYCGENEASSAKYYETIVRKLRTQLPNADIVSIFTTDKGNANTYGADEMNKFATVHNAVAEKYDVTTIDVGRALIKAMTTTDVWDYYMTDIVHPKNTGYEVYTKVIRQFLTDEYTSRYNTAEISAHTTPSDYYSSDAAIFATNVIKVTDEAVTYDSGFEYGTGNVLSGTKIDGYITPKTDGATVEVKFVGTELNVFMEFAGGKYDIKYQLDDEAFVTKNINDTNHPLKLLSGLSREEHTVKLVFPTANESVKIGAFFAGESQYDDVTVTFEYDVDGETQTSTKTLAYGAKLVYPTDITLPASERDGYYNTWSIDEGTRIWENTTVTVTEKKIAPTELFAGPGLDFYFTYRHYAEHFAFLGTSQSKTFSDNAGTFTLVSYDAEKVFNYATGVYEFKESHNGWYGATDSGNDNIAFFPIVNFKEEAKYLAIGISVRDCPNIGARNGNIKLTLSNGSTVEAAADFTNTENGITKVIVDASEVIPDGATIRYIKINPWAYKNVNIDKDSKVDFEYIASFNSLEMAEGYIHDSYVTPDAYTVTVNVDDDTTGTINVDHRGTTTSYTGTHYAGERVNFTATPADKYCSFIGWYNGEDLVSADKSIDVVMSSNVNYTARFSVQTAKLRVSTPDSNGTFTVNGQSGAFDADVRLGKSITLVATPAQTYKFDGWYDITNSGNTLITKDTTFVYTPEAAASLEARFMPESVKVGAMLKVSSGEGESNVSTIHINGSEVGSTYEGYHNSGDPIELKAVPNDGYKVAYWIRSSSHGGTTSKVFIGTGDTINAYALGYGYFYIPVLKTEDSQICLYLDYDGKPIMDTEDANDAPEIPEKLGYVATEWKLYIDDSAKSGVKVYKPDYKRPSSTDDGVTKYTLTIMGDPDHVDGYAEQYVYDAPIALSTALENPVWTLTKIGDKDVSVVLSYSSSFTFHHPVTADVTITLTNGDGTAKPVIGVIDASYVETDECIRFAGIFELPEGYTRVEHGFLMTNDASVGASEEAFVVESSSNIIHGRVSNPKTTPVFFINKGHPGNDTWYGRPYLIYEVGEQTHVVYGEIVSANAQ